MRPVLALVLTISAFLVGCAAEQGDDEVMIALVIENEMDRHIVSTNIEFTPESGVHTFGNIVSGGNRGNLGFPVNAYPTAMRVTYYVSTDSSLTARQAALEGDSEKVVRDVELFEPERNRGNYPEYHLIIREDGSIEQVRDIEEDEAAQREAAAEEDDTPSTDAAPEE